MRIKNTITKQFHWIFLLVLFFSLFAPNLLREGMFVDGIWYAAISHNLELGIGDYWHPSFTKTIFKEFYEHPPLVFWLQSFFFKILGDSFWVERIYCLTVFVATTIIISKCWILIYQNDNKLQKLFYLPVFLWMTNFQTFFAYPNNLLECTLTVFTMCSIYCLLKSLSFKNVKTYSLIVLAGVFIFLGFLSKGFVALFPLIFFILYFLIFKQKLKSQIIKTSALLLSFVICALVLLQFESSREFILKYIDIQVIESLRGNRVENIRESRFYIIYGIFKSMPISFGISLVVLFSSFIINDKKIIENTKCKYIFLFLFLGIASSLPLIISLKQAGYYLVPSTPLFILALSIWIAPSFNSLLAEIKNKKIYNYSSYIIMLLLLISFALAIKNVGTVDKRDREHLANLREVIKVVPNNSIINFKADKLDYSIVGLYQRYNLISLDTSFIEQRKFLVIEKNVDTTKIQNYKRISNQSENYNIYTRINP
ncbi:ArnT family glycosyltransferase [Maribacter sp. X9]|uniref:ArnT family glycosyltransferase n=1 Tax=Maribacter sp. X9 TaxID=3402159 RepID=UPI003AF35FB0